MLLFPCYSYDASILFPDDLLRILGKFVTTLHSSNSSSNCYHCVEHTLSFYHYANPLAHSFTWTDIHFCPVFGYDPLSYFIISVVFSPCLSLLIASFLPFFLVTLALSLFQSLPKWYPDFLR